MNGLTERGRLRRPLGRWFPGLYAGEWWYNPEDEALFQQTSDITRAFHRVPGRPLRNTLARFQNPTEIEQLPEGLHPASVAIGYASILESLPQLYRIL